MSDPIYDLLSESARERLTHQIDECETLIESHHEISDSDREKLEALVSTARAALAERDLDRAADLKIRILASLQAAVAAAA